jgi:adenylate kinase
MSMKKQAYIFIGPPGSGKGSLSKLCVQQYGWAQLSTGNLCRQHIAHQTKIGKEIAFAIKSGSLISDNLITSMVQEWLIEKIDTVQGFIFDGYPRVVAQAQAFDDILKSQFPNLSLAIVHFVISDDALIARLSGRIICKNSDCQAVYSTIKGSSQQPKQAMVCDMCGTSLGQRDDDQLTSVKERLSIYHKHEQDLLGFYKKIGQPIISLDTDRSLNEVFEEFKQVLGLETA